jgi:hypothetical protein
MDTGEPPQLFSMIVRRSATAFPFRSLLIIRAKAR